MQSLNGNVSLLVAERGSVWKPWVERARGQGREVIVTHQAPEESASAFALRVRGRIAELEAAGQRVSAGVLVGGGRSDPDALSARSLVIRSVAASMARCGGGQMLLDHHGSDRFSMHALATTVSGMVRGTGVDVRTAQQTPTYAEAAA